MAITINTNSKDVITPDELLDWALENIDPTDDESMLTAAERLYALNNNRSFIVEKICAQMKFLADGMGSGQASAQGTVHASGSGAKGGFTVRSVIWTPPLTNNSRSRQLQDQILSFDLPHDHNFGLLTIGYLGVGYKTKIYEYNRDDVLGYPGEVVDMEYLETIQLDEGKIIYFRPGKDIHIQHHPESLSISLNLIGQSNDIRNISQYEFDVNEKKIKKLLSGNSVQSMLLPFEMAKLLGADENMIDVLCTLAKNHQSDQIRNAAYLTLSEIYPCESERFLQGGMDDASNLVKRTVGNLFALESRV